MFCLYSAVVCCSCVVVVVPAVSVFVVVCVCHQCHPLSPVPPFVCGCVCLREDVLHVKHAGGQRPVFARCPGRLDA